MGKLIAAEAAKNLIPCSLELGGKSPVIVWKDVDLDEARSLPLHLSQSECPALLTHY